MQRHITGLIAAAAALGMAGTLTACGGGSGDVTLKLVAADYGDSSANNSQQYWDKLAAAFEKDHPDIKVEVDVYSWQDVDSKVKEMVDAGEAPDMAQIGAYADYAAAGKLYSADQLLSVPVQADFVDEMSQAGKINGTQYGLPFAASTRRLFYNKDLFAKAHITPPKTWSELVADARVLKAQGVTYPFALPLGTEEAQAETLIWMLSNGGGYTDNVGSYAIDTKKNVQALNWLRTDLVGKGLTGPTAPSDLNRTPAFKAFAKGEVGMISGHPTLMNMAKAQGVDYGDVAIPGPGGTPKSRMGVNDWMMAFKQGGHPKETGEFLDYVYNRKNVLDFSREYTLAPVTVSASDAMVDSSQDKALRPFIDELADATYYPANKTSWPQVSAQIKKRISAAVTANGSAAAVLGGIQAEAAAAESAE
ncbi:MULTISPECIES: extracellular solute-binding protein [unclassified Streptomyces]|uniref:extracellular solute-binding protein n=2 Tax=unclassified Streptomyces TaxID=2593676 RepID=UPI0003A327C1|nr:extracellular solute-binding protein [Streptomyces sp. HmicA12]